MISIYKRNKSSTTKIDYTTIKQPNPELELLQEQYRQQLAIRCSRYDISVADYELLLEQQHHSCAGCGIRNSSKNKLHIDHDHKTGKVRGLLCGRCNRVLGHLKDDIHTLEALIRYLQQTQ